MTTAEMERRLTVALRSADTVPVDVAAGREALRLRETDQRRTGRRLLVAAVAAAVVAAGLTVALVARLVDPGPPVVPTQELTVSPSGLPVGELHGKVRLANEGGIGNRLVTIVVRPDGTGTYGRDDLGDATPFDVTIRRDAQGRAVLDYAGPVCTDPKALTLEFTVRAQGVTIDQATPGPGSCLLSADDAAALRGVTFDLFPLPRTD